MTFGPAALVGVAEMDVEELVDDARLLTNVLGATADGIGSVLKICAAAVIERAAVATPTNRRDPYMLLLLLLLSISARHVLPGDRVFRREYFKEGGRGKKKRF